MKLNVGTIHLLTLLCLIITGCNSDVFIDRFELSTKEISLTEGDNVSINVSSSRWAISGFNRTSSQSYKVTAYDSEGKETTDLTLSKPGAIIYETNTSKLMVERIGSKQLVIYLLRNNEIDDHHYEIVLTDYTQEQYISIMIRGIKYELVSVEYYSPKVITDENMSETISNITVSNQSDKGIYVNIYPYRNSLSEDVTGSITFTCSSEFNKIFADESFIFEVPEIVDGTLVNRGLIAEYNALFPYTSSIDLDLPYDDYVAMPVPANSKVKFSSTISLAKYKFNYRLSIKNPNTNEISTIEGLATVILPQPSYIINSEIVN